MIKVYADAATSNQYGPSGAGVIITSPTRHDQLHFPLKIMNNHQAEFMAVILALRQLKKLQLTEDFIILHTDSKTVLDVIDKGSTKNPDYLSYWENLAFLLPHFTNLSFKWLPDSKHAGAHTLAQLGLKEAREKLPN